MFTFPSISFYISLQNTFFASLPSTCARKTSHFSMKKHFPNFLGAVSMFHAVYVYYIIYVVDSTGTKQYGIPSMYVWFILWCDFSVKWNVSGKILLLHFGKQHLKIIFLFFLWQIMRLLNLFIAMHTPNCYFHFMRHFFFHRHFFSHLYFRLFDYIKK